MLQPKPKQHNSSRSLVVFVGLFVVLAVHVWRGLFWSVPLALALYATGTDVNGELLAWYEAVVTSHAWRDPLRLLALR